MAQNWDPDFTEALLLAPNYRSFIEIYLGRGGVRGRKISHSQFCKMAGFASRSYVRDILDGRKRLTSSAMLRISQAMKLNSEWKEYFRLLVAAAESDSNYDGWDSEKLKTHLEKAKARLSVRIRKSPSDSDSEKIEKLFGLRGVPQVYAALGTQNHGASLEEIQSRTNLPMAIIRNAIHGLVELDHIESDACRFKPKNPHFLSTELGKVANYQSMIVCALEQSTKRARRSIDSREDLFFHSAFSVKKEMLPTLKRELRDLLIRYIDASEDASGDSVVSLTSVLETGA